MLKKDNIATKTLTQLLNENVQNGHAMEIFGTRVQYKFVLNAKRTVGRVLVVYVFSTFSTNKIYD